MMAHLTKFFMEVKQSILRLLVYTIDKAKACESFHVFKSKGHRTALFNFLHISDISLCVGIGTNEPPSLILMFENAYLITS